MARTKKHHFLPQFYLRGFATESNAQKVHSIEKSQEARSFLAAIEDAGVKSDYHTIVRAGSQKDSVSVEQELAKLEHHQAITVRRILVREPLSRADRLNVLSMFSLMRVRVPAFKRFMERQYIQTVKTLNSLLAKGTRLEQAVEKHGINVGSELSQAARAALFDRMRRMIRSDAYDVQVANALLLNSMFRQAFNSEIMSVLQRMRLTIYDVDDGLCLATCDQPIAQFNPRRAPALVDMGTELTLPISSVCILKLDWEKGHDGRGTISADLVEECNRRTIVSAEKYVYTGSHLEAIQQLVRKYQKTHSRMQCSTAQKSGEDAIFVISEFVPVGPPNSES